MKMYSKDHVMWRCVSQLRDLAENDNMSSLRQMEVARGLERWAQSKSGQSGWERMCYAASCEAQRMRNSARKR